MKFFFQKFCEKIRKYHCTIRTLPWRHSIKWPIVMRDGTAWGLIMMSGTVPSEVNGISCNKNSTIIVIKWEIDEKNGKKWRKKLEKNDEKNWKKMMRILEIYLHSVSHAACSLLTVPTGEFIANLWDTNGAHSYFAELLSVRVDREKDLVDDARLTGTEVGAGVLLREAPFISGSVLKTHRNITSHEIEKKELNFSRHERTQKVRAVSGHIKTGDQRHDSVRP